jgi:hypothetical protein
LSALIVSVPSSVCRQVNQLGSSPWSALLHWTCEFCVALSLDYLVCCGINLMW